MNIIDLIVFLAIGTLVGWIAGLLVKGKGAGLLGNIIVGIVGQLLGGYIFGLLGITTGGLLGAIIMAVIGAVVLLYLIRLLKKL